MEIHSAIHGTVSEIFVHIRIIIGIILGLCISRLLTGLARFVQHPAYEIIYSVHLAWVAFMLLAIVHFWWFEFYLQWISVWHFGIYLYVIFYASLYFFASTLLFPDHMQEYSGYRDYFMSRRNWFFSIMILIYIADIGDTLLKGQDHFDAHGIEYPIRAAVFILACLVAMLTTSQRFHVIFVALAIIDEIVFIVRDYSTLG
ncbi:hypothetical protein DUT91_05995 [Phyllobacterium salinisoli]|uniref:Uncharacterized protein n=1 Tax=Phyllobacterium salinisoli TaxID=1899321 RepID=A0A368K6Y1_9HYPH|nr:hypothetical protein [Phyllobacterium salinisoli]RCS24991.1 hypothetical protein DUT91_05995 [Phyllobacterium salinisoli]